MKVGNVDGLQIRQLISDPVLESSMNDVKLETWNTFVLTVKKFLGNKARNDSELVTNMLTALQKPQSQHENQYLLLLHTYGSVS